MTPQSLCPTILIQPPELTPKLPRILLGVFILRGNSCLKRGIGGPGGFWCCWSFLVPVEGAEIPSRDCVMSQAEELHVINPFNYMHGHDTGSLCQDKHPEYWKTTCLEPSIKLIQKKSLISIKLEVFKEKLPDFLQGSVFSDLPSVTFL